MNQRQGARDLIEILDTFMHFMFGELWVRENVKYYLLLLLLLLLFPLYMLPSDGFWCLVYPWGVLAFTPVGGVRFDAIYPRLKYLFGFPVSNFYFGDPHFLMDFLSLNLLVFLCFLGLFYEWYFGGGFASQGLRLLCLVVSGYFFFDLLQFILSLLLSKLILLGFYPLVLYALYRLLRLVVKYFRFDKSFICGLLSVIILLSGFFFVVPERFERYSEYLYDDWVELQPYEVKFFNFTFTCRDRFAVHAIGLSCRGDNGSIGVVGLIRGDVDESFRLLTNSTMSIRREFVFGSTYLGFILPNYHAFEFRLKLVNDHSFPLGFHFYVSVAVFKRFICSDFWFLGLILILSSVIIVFVGDLKAIRFIFL